MTWLTSPFLTCLEGTAKLTIEGAINNSDSLPCFFWPVHYLAVNFASAKLKEQHQFVALHILRLASLPTLVTTGNSSSALAKLRSDDTSGHSGVR